MEIRCIVNSPISGSMNMALDEALMASAGAGGINLRFYGWSPPCLSFGRNQLAKGRYDPRAAERRGIDVVRRPTGGRAVLHHREITYSVTAPAEWGGGLRPSYERINRALGRGLSELGVSADGPDETERHRTSRSEGPPPPLARACFRDPLPGEVTSGGRKLVGSAQWRRDGALLQHGSILLHDDQAIVDQLLINRTRGPDPPPSGACSIHELLGGLPPMDDILTALASGFEREFRARIRRDEPTGAECREAARLEKRYRTDRWTWRR